MGRDGGVKYKRREAEQDGNQDTPLRRKIREKEERIRDRWEWMEGVKEGGKMP